MENTIVHYKCRYETSKVKYAYCVKASASLIYIFVFFLVLIFLFITSADTRSRQANYTCYVTSSGRLIYVFVLFSRVNVFVRPLRLGFSPSKLETITASLHNVLDVNGIQNKSPEPNLNGIGFTIINPSPFFDTSTAAQRCNGI